MLPLSSPRLFNGYGEKITSNDFMRGKQDNKQRRNGPRRELRSAGNDRNNGPADQIGKSRTKKRCTEHTKRNSHYSA